MSTSLSLLDDTTERHSHCASQADPLPRSESETAKAGEQGDVLTARRALVRVCEVVEEQRDTSRPGVALGTRAFS